MCEKKNNNNFTWIYMVCFVFRFINSCFVTTTSTPKVIFVIFLLLCLMYLCFVIFGCVWSCDRVHTSVCVLARTKWSFFVGCMKMIKFGWNKRPCIEKCKIKREDVDEKPDACRKKQKSNVIQRTMKKVGVFTFSKLIYLT